MGTESYLLAFDPRWAWEAHGAWITLYNKNTQNQYGFHWNMTQVYKHVALNMFFALLDICYGELATVV